MLERFRFPYPGIRIPLDFSNHCIDSFERLSVNLLPVEVIFPSVFVEANEQFLSLLVNQIFAFILAFFNVPDCAQNPAPVGFGAKKVHGFLPGIVFIQ